MAVLFGNRIIQPFNNFTPLSKNCPNALHLGNFLFKISLLEKMTAKTNYWIRRTHRFMGVILGVQFLLWTIGGLYFSWS
jgi:hypothetical protein